MVSDILPFFDNLLFTLNIYIELKIKYTEILFFFSFFRKFSFLCFRRRKKNCCDLRVDHMTKAFSHMTGT